MLVRLAQLGVSAEVDAVPSAFLGAVELTPLEVTQIYQSIAGSGFSSNINATPLIQCA